MKDNDSEDENENKVDPKKVFAYVKAIFEYEKEVEKNKTNYTWNEIHPGYIIKLVDYEKLKNKIKYDDLKKYINDKNLLKQEINKLIDSNQINDELLTDFDRLRKIDKKNLKESIKANKEFKLINKELWDVIYGKDKSPLMYEFDYPEMTIHLSEKDISFSCINNNILNQYSIISIEGDKLMNIAKSIIEFHKFENEIVSNLKDKKEDIKKYSGYFISKNWVDNWKSYINYDRLNFDEKENDLIYKIMKQVNNYLKKNHGKKMLELKFLNFKSADEFENYLKNDSLVLINEVFYFLVEKKKIEEKHEIHFTASDRIINVFLKNGKVKIASYGNLILSNNIKEINYFIKGTNNLEMTNVKEPIYSNEEDDEKSLWSSFTFIGKKNNKNINGYNNNLNIMNNKDNNNIINNKDNNNIINNEVNNNIINNKVNNNIINNEVNNNIINNEVNNNNIINDNNIVHDINNNINPDVNNNINDPNNNDKVVNQINNEEINNKNEINNNNNIQSNKEKKILENIFKLGGPHRGLTNIGATCYMNSSLQCFCHIKKLVQFFKYSQQANNIKDNNNLSSSFKLLVDNLWPEDNNYKSSFSPYDFKDKISKMNSLFEGIAANDAKDLVNFIILTLHQELNKKVTNNNNANNDVFIDQTNQNMIFNYFVKDFMDNNQSIISDLFYSMNCTISQCHNCYTRIYNYQTYFFLCFPLEEIRKYKNEKYNYQVNNYQINNYQVNNENEVNIYDCFDYDCKINIMDGAQSMFCNYCNQNMTFSLATHLVTGSEILVIILNRGKGIEFDVKINFTEELNLYNYIEYKNTGYQYRLFGVITHIGESSMNGHFIAYCRDPINLKWYKYNDAFVNEVNDFQNEVINFAMPYLLFYQKIDV